MNNVITLSTAGLSPQETTVIGVAANLLAALDHTIKVLENGDLSGDIVVLGAGSEVERRVVGQLDSGQRILFYVDEDGQAPGAHTLVRPVRVQTLRDALAELVILLPSKRERAEPVPKPPPASPAPAATPRPASAVTAMPHTLFYMLLDAVIKRELLRVDCGGGTTILIHGPTQCIYTHADGMSLEKMSQQSFDMLTSQKLGESDFMHATKGMSLTRLHDVIWLAERYGGRGQLLPGHSLEMPVQLKVWPKFNNRHVQPENLKLAALLSKRPLSLRVLAESSGVSQAQVIDFYNASVAFGVVETKESAAQVDLPKPVKSGGLLDKIARRLALKRD